MKTIRTAAVIASAALTGLMLFASAGCQLFGGNAAASTKDLPEARTGTLVITVEAEGNLTLPRQQKLSFETSGTIVEVKALKGDRVMAGDILARLDDTSMVNAVKQQELALTQYEQEVNLARADLQRAEEQLEEAAPKSPALFTYYTDMPRVKTNIELARTAAEEAGSLVKAGNSVEGGARLNDVLKYLDEAYAASGSSQFLDIGKQRGVSDTISSLRQLTYQQERAQANLARAQAAVDASRLAVNQGCKDLR